MFKLSCWTVNYLSSSPDTVQVLVVDFSFCPKEVKDALTLLDNLKKKMIMIYFTK